MDGSRHEAATTDALRGAIDRGAARDKVQAGDPAAAPLGTDDEAAGTPPEPARLELAAAHELTSRGAVEARAGRGRRARRLGAVLLLVSSIVAVVAIPVLLR